MPHRLKLQLEEPTQPDNLIVDLTGTLQWITTASFFILQVSQQLPELFWCKDTGCELKAITLDGSIYPADSSFVSL